MSKKDTAGGVGGSDAHEAAAAAGPPQSARQEKEHPEKDRRRYLAPAFIVALAIAIRVLFTIQVYQSEWLNLSRSQDIITTPSGIARQGRNDGTDMEAYDYIARRVIRNGWFEKSADASPLYPYGFLPLAYLLTGSNLLWTIIIQAVFDGVTVLLIYLIALRLYDRRAAVYAGLIAAVYAPFIVYQANLLGEFLLNLLVAALILVLLGVEGRITYKRAVALGALFGLAALAKPTVVVFVPLSAVWLWVRAGSLKRIVTPGAVTAAVALAVILPFSYRNWRGSGEFILIRGNSGKMLYMGNNPRATGAYGEPRGPEAARLAEETRDMPLREKDAVYARAAVQYIRENPRHFLRLLERKFKFFFGAEEIANNVSVTLHRQKTFLKTRVFVGFGFVFPLAVAGFAFSLRRRGVWLLAGQFAIYAAAIILIVVVGRYRLAVVPLLMPAAGFALSEMIFAFKSLEMPRTLGILAVTLAAATPVNWNGLKHLALQKLHPSGFTSTEDGTIIYHDDSNVPTPYAATLSREGRIRKLIHVAEVPEGLREAVVAVMMSVGRAGTLTVKLNDIPWSRPLPEGRARWLYVSFPPGTVRQGFNAIDLEGDGQLEAFVFADDVYHFGRSFYKPREGYIWITRGLDLVTYRTHPSLHIGGSEFKVRLALPVGERPARAPAG